MLGKIAAAPAIAPRAITAATAPSFNFPAALMAIMLGPAVAMPIRIALMTDHKIDPRKMSGRVMSC